MQDNDNPSPFRDTIRERNAINRAQDALAEFEASRPGFTDLDWAAWTGTLSAAVEDLLAVSGNLQAVADHAEGGTARNASMPNVFELIATIKDIHRSGPDDTCRECGQAPPCRTYRRVDAVVAARFEDGQS